MTTSRPRLGAVPQTIALWQEPRPRRSSPHKMQSELARRIENPGRVVAVSPLDLVRRLDPERALEWERVAVAALEAMFPRSRVEHVVVGAARHRVDIPEYDDLRYGLRPFADESDEEEADDTPDCEELNADANEALREAWDLFANTAE